MKYVRVYGRPDLFITFTCNPQWDEIKKLLLPGQFPSDPHDVTARVFKQKLKSLIDLIVKLRIFKEIKCWMYSIEWQKRDVVIPHAHILIWCVEKIRPADIDKIISAEIPDKNIDPELLTIVTTSMIHGPCGTINLHLPSMDNKRCTKRFPKPFLKDTITGNDYRRRSPDQDGRILFN